VTAQASLPVLVIGTEVSVVANKRHERLNITSDSRGGDNNGTDDA
jgi:hypothetical protein